MTRNIMITAFLIGALLFLAAFIAVVVETRIPLL